MHFTIAIFIVFLITRVGALSTSDVLAASKQILPSTSIVPNYKVLKEDALYSIGWYETVRLVTSTVLVTFTQNPGSYGLSGNTSFTAPAISTCTGNLSLNCIKEVETESVKGLDTATNMPEIESKSLLSPVTSAKATASVIQTETSYETSAFGNRTSMLAMSASFSTAEPTTTSSVLRATSLPPTTTSIESQTTATGSSIESRITATRTISLANSTTEFGSGYGNSTRSSTRDSTRSSTRGLLTTSSSAEEGISNSGDTVVATNTLSPKETTSSGVRTSAMWTVWCIVLNSMLLMIF